MSLAVYVVGFLFSVSATAGFKYTLNCPKVPTIKANTSLYEGDWYEFTHSSGQGYTCQQYFESNEQDGTNNNETYFYRTKLDNGTVEEEVDAVQTPKDPWSYYDEDPNGEWIFYIYDVEITDTYWLEYGCFQNGTQVYPLLWLNTRGLTVPAKARENMDKINKDNNLKLTIESNPDSCSGM